MKEITTTVTKAGQITLPAEIRRLLDIEIGDRVTFQVEGKDIRLTPAKWTLATLAGSVPPARSGLDVDDAIRAANEEMAVNIIRQLNE